MNNEIENKHFMDRITSPMQQYELNSSAPKVMTTDASTQKL